MSISAGSRIIRTAIPSAALVGFLLAGCKEEKPAQPQATPGKSPGGEVVYKDAGVPVTNDKEETDALVYWYESQKKTLHVFKADALREMIAEGVAKEIVWTPGQAFAQVTTAAGQGAIKADVVNYSTMELPIDAIFASVGDMRRLGSYRERHTFREDLSGCLTDLRFAPIFRPGGTMAYRTSRRYHEYLQGPGTVKAPETVENTARYIYYPVNDSLACKFYPTTDERMPRWVTAVHAWPEP